MQQSPSHASLLCFPETALWECTHWHFEARIKQVVWHLDWWPRLMLSQIETSMRPSSIQSHREINTDKNIALLLWPHVYSVCVKDKWGIYSQLTSHDPQVQCVASTLSVDWNECLCCWKLQSSNGTFSAWEERSAIYFKGNRSIIHSFIHSARILKT